MNVLFLSFFFFSFLFFSFLHAHCFAKSARCFERASLNPIRGVGPIAFVCEYLSILFFLSFFPFFLIFMASFPNRSEPMCGIFLRERKKPWQRCCPCMFLGHVVLTQAGISPQQQFWGFLGQGHGPLEGGAPPTRDPLVLLRGLAAVLGWQDWVARMVPIPSPP